jgi:putative membrane protein
METACRLAHWPIVLRSDAFTLRQAQPNPRRSAYRPAEARALARQALGDTLDLFRAGRLLVVFPEAYPNVDPDYAAKADQDYLPFRPGFARLAARAERQLGQELPILPAGFAYRRTDRWQVVLHFGPLTSLRAHPDAASLVRYLETEIQALSHPTWLPNTR